MAEPFNVFAHDFVGGRVFALCGELDASTCEGLAETLSGPHESLIVIDLRLLTFMDSSGLGAIHAAWRNAITNGGALVVSRPSPIVQRVLQITGLDLWVTEWNPTWSSGSTMKCAPS
jgi:stage II sporulation protein AA (anti-sigma F factor antagonist)